MTTTNDIIETVLDWLFFLLTWIIWIVRWVLWRLINLVVEIATNKLPGEKVKVPRRSPQGIEYERAASVFKLSKSKICGLYFLILGEVNEMKQAFDVREMDAPDHYFCKVGKSNHLGRRFNEHNDNYGKMRGSQMRLAAFETVKLKNLSTAEAEMLTELAKLFPRVDNAKYNEVFVIPANKLRQAQTVLEKVAVKYV